MSTISEQDVRSKNIRVRRAADRGYANYGWLDTWHTFSFNRGSVVINGQSLGTSDDAAISGEEAVAVRTTVSSELLLFDMT